MRAVTASVTRKVEYFDKMTVGVVKNTVWCEPNEGVPTAYHGLWDLYPEEPILFYVHDDVEIHEPWVERVEQTFVDHPKLAVLGFGGATGIGNSDLYKVPYRLNDLARQNYASNQTDWQIHGTLETGYRRVAVVDGFVMALNTNFLDLIGGWKWIKSNFHCYDLAMCLMAARKGWEVGMIGVNCTHHGGGTSTTPEYRQWCKDHGTTLELEHQEPHRWMYEEFRDVLPLRVKGA